MNYTTLPHLDPSIFRAYDIRGRVDQGLTENSVYTLGLAIGSKIRESGRTQVVTGRDGRLSSPSLSLALEQGLLASGCDVTSVGAVPTPLVYFAGCAWSIDCAVMLTGSHNPADYNGLKIIVAGKTLTTEAITALCERISQQAFVLGEGHLKKQDIVPAYIQRIVSDVHLARRLKVVIDCGNGIGGRIAPELFQALGCDLIELYCEVDGRFPHHHPDPTREENLKDLIDTVRSQKADVGLAFDGDADRLGVVSPTGEIIWADRQLMLFAEDILKRYPGADIIYDVKCTRHLPVIIQQAGGHPILSKTGHSLVKAKLQETGAPLAGELSGHIFFKDRWYGFDDGLYAGARLLELLTADTRPVSTIFSALPTGINTPELHLPLSEEEKFTFTEEFVRKAQFPSATITTIDGLRVDYPDSWGILRASNTTPCLTIRFEGDNIAALERIKTTFRQQILAIKPNAQVPF